MAHRSRNSEQARRTSRNRLAVSTHDLCCLCEQPMTYLSELGRSKHERGGLPIADFQLSIEKRCPAFQSAIGNSVGGPLP